MVTRKRRRPVEFLLIAGLSGAGRSQAADTFEDQGWFVIDNLPPTLIGKVAELVQAPGSTIGKVALVVGTGAYLGEVQPAVNALRESGGDVRILFLEASDTVLVRRYEGTRRRHPLGDEGVTSAIDAERQLLQPLKDQADVVVDTSDLNVHELRDRLLDLFARDEGVTAMQTTILSFGYKHGLPLDVDLVFDCRFLPNPHWVEELRPLTGIDAPVRDYVLGQPDTSQFLLKVDDLLGLLLPAYVKEGKSYLTIGVGCTGGHHRSVAVSEELARILRERGFDPVVRHRDIDK